MNLQLEYHSDIEDTFPLIASIDNNRLMVLYLRKLRLLLFYSNV